MIIYEVSNREVGDYGYGLYYVDRKFYLNLENAIKDLSGRKQEHEDAILEDHHIEEEMSTIGSKLLKVNNQDG